MLYRFYLRPSQASNPGTLPAFLQSYECQFFSEIIAFSTGGGTMKMRGIRTFFRVFLRASALLLITATSWSQTLIWLGVLPGYQRGTATDVSADGTVIIGFSYDPTISGNRRAFRWTRAEGIQDLGTLGGTQSAAYNISLDGTVVVGWAHNADGYLRAFRWTPTQGMQDLGTLGGNESAAFGISADSTVIVGYAHNADGYLRAFRWTPTQGMQDLGTLGGNESAAFGVSADGTVIVGYAHNTNGHRRAFRWTQETGLQEIPNAFGGRESICYSASANGTVVVGQARNASGDWRAFRWTPEEGVQDLGTPGLTWSWGQDVSADGTVVVGYVYDRNEPLNRYIAFRWTQGMGADNLSLSYGSLLTDGSLLIIANALSPDGRYIVGEGYNATAQRYMPFLLDTWRTGDTNGDGCIDDTDLLKVLFAFGTPGTGYTRHEDINKDGIVDDADLLIVLFHFDSGC